MDKKSDTKKFGGKYVATRSFTDDEVIAFGKDPIEVYNKAVEMGVKDPVIDYIFEEGIPYCFEISRCSTVVV
jgi:hypothetical protein